MNENAVEIVSLHCDSLLRVCRTHYTFMYVYIYMYVYVSIFDVYGAIKKSTYHPPCLGMSRTYRAYLRRHTHTHTHAHTHTRTHTHTAECVK